MTTRGGRRQPGLMLRGRRRGARGAARTGARRGMTLIEMLVAVTILGTVLVALCGVLTGFVRNLNIDAQRARSLDLAVARLESLKGIGRYETLVAQSRTEGAIAGYPGFTRITVVQRVQTSRDDYARVTVKVVGRQSRKDTVSKSTVIPRY